MTNKIFDDIFDLLLQTSSSTIKSRKLKEHKVRYLSSAETAVTLSSKEDAEEIYRASIAFEPKQTKEETEEKIAI